MLPLVAFVLCAPAAGPLEAVVAPTAKAHAGDIAVAVKHLVTGEEYSLNGDTPMPTASLIKLAVMVEAFHQVEAKKLDLSKTLTLTADDKVQGAGILTDHFSDGATFPVKDAIRLMIVFSDNTATNMVIDQFGIQAVNDRTAKLGLPETRLNGKVFKGTKTTLDPDRLKKYGLGSTTAKETVKLLEMIHAGKVASPAACKTMLGHLKANDDKEMIVRFLPAGVTAYHKTGAVNAARTDAGILTWKDAAGAEQAVALCVLTNENKDRRWVFDNAAQVTIATIARDVVAYFKK